MFCSKACGINPFIKQMIMSSGNMPGLFLSRGHRTVNKIDNVSDCIGVYISAEGDRNQSNKGIFTVFPIVTIFRTKVHKGKEAKSKYKNEIYFLFCSFTFGG
jgi:hypothetical protein